jgi:predicted nucleic acid-binding Zn ribbon protein
MTQGQTSIQTLLGGLLKNRQMVASMRRVMVMSLWEQVVGQLVAQKAWPEKVADGVLTIGVTSHAWATELQLLKPQILTRYRQLLGRTILKSNPEVRDLLAPVFARLRAQREWKREHGWAHCNTCERIYHGQHCPYCTP